MTIQRIDTVDIHNLTTDSVSSGDFLAFSDEDEAGDISNKITVDNFVTAIAGSGLSASGIQLTASGSGASLTGSTDNTVTTVTGADAIQGEANLTFDGNSLGVTTGSASAVAVTIIGASGQSVDLVQCQDTSGNNLLMIDQAGSIRLGLAGDREVHVEPESGTNAAGKDIFIKGGKSTGTGEGGDIRFYTSPVGSSGSSVNGWAEALKIRHDKKLDFKITAQDESGLDLEDSEHKWLPIQVRGVDYFLPLYREEVDPGGCTWQWNYNYEQYQLISSDCAPGYECPYLDINTFQGATVNRDCQQS